MTTGSARSCLAICRKMDGCWRIAATTRTGSGPLSPSVARGPTSRGTVRNSVREAVMMERSESSHGYRERTSGPVAGGSRCE
jgi:hypothetical protein